MGLKLTNLVWDSPDFTGTDLLLALAMADRADDKDGGKLYASLEWYAKRTKQSPRTVRRQLSRFRDMGWLIVERGIKGGRNTTTHYRINPEWINGVNLAGLARKKADTVGIKPGQSRSQTRTNEVRNPDIAVSYNPTDPSLSLNIRKTIKGQTPEETERKRRDMSELVASLKAS